MALELNPGQIIAGDYRIVGPIGAGGMGTVYQVQQLSTGKLRALKVLHVVDPKHREDMRRRFEQEARITATIQSEHIVDIIGAGVDEQRGLPWLAMELLTGEPLDVLMERVGSLSIGETLSIARQIFHGVAAAHDARLVHRDLKPENVYLARSRIADGTTLVKVLDFGVAKLLEDDARTTAAVGTPLWMAPEQTEARGRVGPETDVWALALMVFHMLTGKYYWLAAQVEGEGGAGPLIREIVVNPLEAPSVRAQALGISLGLPNFDAWFGRCVVRSPTERYADAREAWAALEPILVSGGQVVGATVPQVPRPSGAAMNITEVISGSEASPVRTQKRALILAGGLVSLGLVGAGTVSAVWPKHEARSETTISRLPTMPPPTILPTQLDALPTVFTTVAGLAPTTPLSVTTVLRPITPKNTAMPTVRVEPHPTQLPVGRPGRL